METFAAGSENESPKIHINQEKCETESRSSSYLNIRQSTSWSLNSLKNCCTGLLSPCRSRKSKNTSDISRSQVQWHRPVTNCMFDSHFKNTNRSEEFHIDQLIAKGAFGCVFKVYPKNNRNKSFALKTIRKSKVIRDSCVQQIKDEADIQKLCGHHPFIVQHSDSWQDRRQLYILSEYVSNGELFSKLCKFTTELIRLYTAEIALAIDFLHNAGVIYRDAKPENILLTSNYHIKITDFGLSKWLKIGDKTRTMCGTHQYMGKMNARTQLFDLTMEGRQVDEAVASIFHTVLFHRCSGKYIYTGDTHYSIGTVGYTDVDCDFFDFTYVCCTSESLHRTVKKAINIFSEKLRSNESSGSGQISLEFFQKKKNRWPFQQECIPWEVWTVHLNLTKFENEDDRQLSRENVSDLLTEKVIYITEVMNRHDYVPKTPSQNELDLIFDTSYPDIQPYLFKFDYNTSGSSTPSVSNTVKKILKETLAL